MEWQGVKKVLEFHVRLPPVPGRINAQVKLVGIYQDAGAIQVAIDRHSGCLFDKGWVANVIELLLACPLADNFAPSRTLLFLEYLVNSLIQ